MTDKSVPFSFHYTSQEKFHKALPKLDDKKNISKSDNKLI